MRDLKKFTAVALVTAMTLGSAMTSFAAASGDAEYTGSGNFEGGETAYPTVSVTLPTIPDEAYDYIADPNGLIARTHSASASSDATSGDASGDIKYGKSIFNGSTGVFFRNGTTDASGTAASGDVQKYDSRSEAWKVTNENAQDIEVKVKLEQAASGDASIQYATDNDFSGDTTRKLYIAVTDGDASGDPAVLGVSAATITKTIDGKADNFTEMYDGVAEKYIYKVKPDATGWNDWSCYMEGALNTGAEWKENDITFPTIKVTWSVAEKPEEPEEKSAVAGAPASGKTWLSKDGSAGFGGATNVDSVTANGQSVAFTGSDWISIPAQAAGTVIKITLKNGDVYKAVAP